jgi:Skp family chaperone for outer membrane proteins
MRCIDRVLLAVGAASLAVLAGSWVFRAELALAAGRSSATASVESSGLGAYDAARGAAEGRIATINILTVVEKMVQSERYRPAREELFKEYSDQVDAAGKEVEAVRARIIELGQDSEQGRALIPQFQLTQRAAQQLQGELQEKAAAFNSQQLAEAYRLAVDTANRIAETKGYSHVIATRGAATDPLRSTNVAAAIQEILARPVVRFPAADDLTDAVAKDLGVDQVAVDGPSPTNTDAATTPPTVTPPTDGTSPK